MSTAHTDVAPDEAPLMIEALLSENDKLKKKLDLMENTLQKCSSCESRVEKKRLRICVDCCSKDNLVRFDSNKDLLIIDLYKVQPSLICGTCCLEGTHEGHKTSLYEPVKLRSTASRQFDELRNSFKEKHRSRLADINFDLKSAVVGLDKPLNEMQQRAMKLRRSVDLEAQVSLVKQFEEEFDEIMGNFIKQGEESVRQIKDIGKRMAEATSRLQIDGEGKENGKGEKKNEKENVCGQREESVEQATSVKVTDHPGQVLGDSDCPYPPLSYQTLEAWFLHNVENGLAHMKQGNASRGAVPLANAIALNLADGMVESFKGILEPDQFRAVLAELPAARKRIPRFSAERNQKENTNKKQ